LNPEPLLSVEAPPNVEVVLQSNDAHQRLLIHLLCFSSPATFVAAPFSKGKQVLPVPMETPMRYEARLTLNRSVLIRLLPKRESANISELCSPGFHFRHRCRTSCGFSRMIQRVRR